MLNLFDDAVQILMTEDSYDIYEAEKIRTILEDATSPVTRKYQEKLYNSVLKKAHIDFDDIPKSKGNIRNYKGYNTMIETINVIEQLAKEAKSIEVLNYVDVLKRAINNIEDLAAAYEKGFATETSYVAMEYDCFVYFCVEATTSLIYSFIEVVKDPQKQTLDMKIKNNKLRANEFYFDELKKFNTTQENLGTDYRKMLEHMCNKGKENFGGVEILGTTALIAAAMSVVPITRSVIYQIYNFRGKLANNLEVQASFLELNKASVEANQALTIDKKKKVLEKQEKLAQKLRKLADDLRVKSSKSVVDATKDLKKDNGTLSIDSLRDDIDNSPLQLF